MDELRFITIPAGTLIGFKACPGVDGSRLLQHAATDKAQSLWSAIYIQLSLSRAINYVPNQYDRGEDVCCICRVTTRRPFHIAICDDVRMSDNTISSKEKAQLIRNATQKTRPEWMTAAVSHEDCPLLEIFEDQDHALCLLDCENYELAVPHKRFNTDLFSVECLLIFPKSILIPGGIIGAVDFLPATPNDGEDDSMNAMRIAFETWCFSKWELADAATLGLLLQERLERSDLMQVRSKWMEESTPTISPLLPLPTTETTTSTPLSTSQVIVVACETNQKERMNK